MTLRTITGHVYLADGSEAPDGSIVVLRPPRGAYTLNGAYLATPIEAIVTDGAISQAVVADLPGQWSIEYPDRTTFKAYINSGAAITLEELRAGGDVPTNAATVNDLIAAALGGYGSLYDALLAILRDSNGDIFTGDGTYITITGSGGTTDPGGGTTVYGFDFSDAANSGYIGVL